MALACIYEAHGAQEKKEQKNNNATRVRSEVFLMNFRIVKKTIGFYMKIENDE